MLAAAPWATHLVSRVSCSFALHPPSFSTFIIPQQNRNKPVVWLSDELSDGGTDELLILEGI